MSCLSVSVPRPRLLPRFSPFAALTGRDAAIAEAARLTDERPIPDESGKKEISNFTVTKRLPAGGSDEVMPAFLFPCGAHSTIIAEGPAIQ